MPIRRLILVRHGETEGESSIRYFGSTDVELSAQGRDQMRAIAGKLGHLEPDLYLASTLRRSWGAASMVSGGASVRIERDLREISFGRWEGLTKEEIQARDPELFSQWEAGAEGFDYPGGEPRAAFQERVRACIDAVLNAPGHQAIGVLHKGVIREIVQHLTGEALPADHPELGERVIVTRRMDGSWGLGQNSSDPVGLDNRAA